MIKNRLLKCCKCDDPEGPFFGSNTDKTLLASFKEKCDYIIQHLYYFYMTIILLSLKKRDLPIGKMDRALIMMALQPNIVHKLSNYIRLELIRRQKWRLKDLIL